VAAPDLPRAGQRELGLQDTWRPRSCPGLGSGLGPQDTWWPWSCPGLGSGN
jgi:hypothetical protein